ncbi:MAG: DUF1566 domain-containing protein [Trichlorobacter sp.]|uniref:Lcl C-terminal domain-containing protein n=1 Tax=Trichlorobacter sp. TaxID=2911007 RepID=UPI00256D939F|nr:DUF1566 domain-containing protein [Trichlorobacter sp.]MDK9717627.1 DUF1566 domain-containing protein [Trichlorobacter sp.]
MKKQIMATVALLGLMVAGTAFAELKDNNDGTLIDTTQRLVWLKQADCFGKVSFFDAQNKPYGLASGMCGLSDKSTAGQWRLPNEIELRSLQGNVSKFNGNISDWYWTSNPGTAPSTSKCILPTNGATQSFDRNSTHYALPVRSIR